MGEVPCDALALRAGYLGGRALQGGRDKHESQPRCDHQGTVGRMRRSAPAQKISAASWRRGYGPPAAARWLLAALCCLLLTLAASSCVLAEIDYAKHRGKPVLVAAFMGGAAATALEVEFYTRMSRLHYFEEIWCRAAVQAQFRFAAWVRAI